VDAHPYRTAWQTRDLDTWADALAPDIVMHSPVLTQPFVGKAVAVELFGVLFDVFGSYEITHELSDGSVHAFFWRSQVGTHSIEGADLIRHDEHGKVSEIRVLIRPLPDLATFASAIGQPLAAKRSTWRGTLAGLLTLPLRAILVIADVIAARLIRE
jgi:hypothetical protein